MPLPVCKWVNAEPCLYDEGTVSNREGIEVTVAPIEPDGDTGKEQTFVLTIHSAWQLVKELLQVLERN